MSGAPSQQPDRGYMGDPRRGASLGRASVMPGSPNHTPRVHIAGIRLDSGGYDSGGAYWGFGGWLWEAWTDDGAFYETGRVTCGDERHEAVKRLNAAGLAWPSTAQIDRETAKAAVRESLGESIRFYR